MDSLEVVHPRGVLVIAASDLSWTAVRASGPGGQNVNKVASKVELRFALARSTALGAAAKARLVALAGAAVDASGELRVVSQKTRDQRQNLEDARAKLAELIARALVVPKTRRPTKPTRGSQERRLQTKREGSERKRSRRELD